MKISYGNFKGYKAKTEHKFINTIMTGKILRALN